MTSATDLALSALLARCNLEKDDHILLVATETSRICAITLLQGLLAVGYRFVGVKIIDCDILSAELVSPDLGKSIGQCDVVLLEECQQRRTRLIEIGLPVICQEESSFSFIEQYLEELAATEVSISAPSIIHFPYAPLDGESDILFYERFCEAEKVELQRNLFLERFYFLSFNSRTASFKAKLEDADELAITGMIQVPICTICGTVFHDFFCGFKNGLIDSYGSSDNASTLKEFFDATPDLKRVSKLYLTDRRTTLLFNETSNGMHSPECSAVIKFGIDNPLLPLLSFTIAFGSHDLEVYGEGRDGRRKIIYKSGEYVE